MLLSVYFPLRVILILDFHSPPWYELICRWCVTITKIVAFSWKVYYDHPLFAELFTHHTWSRYIWHCHVGHAKQQRAFSRHSHDDFHLVFSSHYSLVIGEPTKETVFLPTGSPCTLYNGSSEIAVAVCRFAGLYFLVGLIILGVIHSRQQGDLPSRTYLCLYLLAIEWCCGTFLYTWDCLQASEFLREVFLAYLRHFVLAFFLWLWQCLFPQRSWRRTSISAWGDELPPIEASIVSLPCLLMMCPWISLINSCGSVTPSESLRTTVL